MRSHGSGRRRRSRLWGFVWTAVGWAAFTLPLALYVVYRLA